MEFKYIEVGLTLNARPWDSRSVGVREAFACAKASPLAIAPVETRSND